MIDLFLGAAGPADLRAAANKGDPAALADQACEAAFYTAEFDLLRGDPAGARLLLTEAAASCPTDDIELIAAQRELQRLP